MNRLMMLAFFAGLGCIVGGAFLSTKNTAAGLAMVGAGSGLLGLIKEKPEFFR